MPTVNHYFDGKVSSIRFKATNLSATIGVMEPGEYTFATSQRETMTIISGSLAVKLPCSDSWQTFHENGQFSIEAEKNFQLHVERDTAYMCTYD